MTDIDITSSTIRRLRQRRLELCAELDDVDAELVDLGVNPRLGSLLAAILKAAAMPLSTQRLYDHTEALGLHHLTEKDFVLHLDRLHAAGTIVPIGDKRWATTPPPTPVTHLAPGALID